MAGQDHASGEFSGKAALVTGGAAGIGAAVAELLAERGARVVILDRSREAAEARAAALAGRGLEASAMIGDVSRARARARARDVAAAAIAEAAARPGGLDIVSNHAASSATAPSRPPARPSGTR
jgi:NAD(P)-dependent dehydrogenase (short-subunit alcohol dehydrogenase family)